MDNFKIKPKPQSRFRVEVASPRPSSYDHSQSIPETPCLSGFVPILNEETLSILAEMIAEKLAERLMVEDNKPKYYNRKEVAAILHVSLPTIDRMMQDGRLTAKRVGRRVLFDAQTIDKAVKEKTIFKLKTRRI